MTNAIIFQRILVWYIPLCIVLMSITNSRFELGIGVGEILFIPVMLYSAAKITISKSATVPVFGLFIAYFFSIGIANTLFSYSINTPGVVLRDIIALTFAIFTFIGIASLKLDHRSIAKNYVLLCILLVSGYYFFGGSEAYFYDVRFTAGGKNPNQIAFYLAICASFSMIFYSGISRILLFLVSVYFGLLTMSDGFKVYLTIIVVGILFGAFAKRFPVYSALLSFIPLTFIGWLYYDVIFNKFIEFTLSADNEGSRFILAKNGILAWADNPWSLLLGNGAGSFSGEAKFQLAESHNTFVDIGAQFGLIGFLLFVVPYFILGYAVYKKGYVNSAFAFFGISAFLLVHYVLRQPIFWFFICILYTQYKMQSQTQLNKAVN